MAANLENKLIVSNPDFNTIRSNLKDFMRSQSTFSDYDFEGSGLSNLIDLLAYNTHYMAFYANMIANEAFLDTASLRDAVVSHAKMLGYTPTSVTSARANVDLFFTQANNAAVANITSLTIPRFTRFSGVAIDGVNYIFSNLKEVTVTKSNNAFTFENLEITEGRPVNFVFTYDATNNPLQQFIIPDADIDTSTLEVIVQNSSVDITQTTFTFATDATEVSANSAVYYLDEVNGGQYQIYFGDNILGRSLSDSNLVVVSYLRSKGADANKTNQFTLLDAVGTLTSGTVTLNDAAQGGASAESINRIKFTAPKAFATRNRAVTKTDYISLIQRDYPSLEAVNVWGGEENDPPIYGKVFVSAKPAAGYVLTTTEKQYILNDVIAPLSIVTVTPEFVDPDYNYLNLNVKVTYDPTATTKTPGQIENSVKTAIYNFANTNLDNFNAYFKISRLTRDIDNIETAILSNEVDVTIEKRFEPTISPTAKNYTINFYTPLKKSTSTNRIKSSPAFTSYDKDDVVREVFFEEVPDSSTGISSVLIKAGGSGFTTAPTLRITGDGFGANARAVITNGKITSVIVDAAGAEYSTAVVKAYDVDNNEISSVVLQTVIENTIGKLRSYYFDDNDIKTILQEDAASVNYAEGTITLQNFAPLDIKNSTKTLKFFAVPENNLFSSTRSSIITIDQDDAAAISVSVIPVTT
jgi:hypothetical protein